MAILLFIQLCYQLSFLWPSRAMLPTCKYSFLCVVCRIFSCVPGLYKNYKIKSDKWIFLEKSSITLPRVVQTVRTTDLYSITLPRSCGAGVPAGHVRLGLRVDPPRLSEWRGVVGGRGPNLVLKFCTGRRRRGAVARLKPQQHLWRRTLALRTREYTSNLMKYRSSYIALLPNFKAYAEIRISMGMKRRWKCFILYLIIKIKSFLFQNLITYIIWTWSLH